MQGESVTRIAGWDTHGLPVEIEVEKELKLTGKKAIEALRGGGVQRPRPQERVQVPGRMGDRSPTGSRYWLDYEHPYVTCSNDYIETVWWLLQRLHQRDLLYRGHRVLPYCPRCGTVLSSHELAQGYEDVTTNSVYVTFPLDDGSGRELLVWTTTPWTLLSNVAVAVQPGPRVRRVRGRRSHASSWRRRGPRFPAAPRRARPRSRSSAPRRTFKGRELVGLRYRRPLDVVPLPEDRASRVVVAGDFVTADDGSRPGAPGAGVRRGRLPGGSGARPGPGPAGRRRTGRFTGTTWPEIEGRLVTDEETNDLIIQRLKREGRWHLTQPYSHSYPHCWRCASPLIYYARDSWFVRTSAFKERMLELNRAGRTGIRPRWAPAGSASGWRTTSTGRSPATATGGRRSRCGSVTTTRPTWR